MPVTRRAIPGLRPPCIIAPMSKHKVPTCAECRGLHLAVVARYVTAIYDAAVREWNLSAAQLHFLMALHEAPDSTAGELRAALHADLATILHLARTAMKRNHVEPGPKRANGRKTYRLTQSGFARIAMCHADWQRAQARVQEVLGDALLAELKAVLPRIRAIPLRPERARLRVLNYYDFNEEASDW